VHLLDVLHHSIHFLELCLVLLFGSTLAGYAGALLLVLMMLLIFTFVVGLGFLEGFQLLAHRLYRRFLGEEVLLERAPRFLLPLLLPLLFRLAIILFKLLFSLVFFSLGLFDFFP